MKIKRYTPLKLLAALIYSMSVYSCSLITTSEKSGSIGVVISEPDRIQFQGKGAGAGVALMSTMGPVGIAIGVAIDEGIAVDLRDVAAKAGFSIQNAIVTSLTQTSYNSSTVIFDAADSHQTYLVIKNYGFRSVAGDGDPTHVEIALQLFKDGELLRSVNYPSDLPDSHGFKTAPLDNLRQDGVLVRRLLEEGFTDSIALLFSQQKLAE